MEDSIFSINFTLIILLLIYLCYTDIRYRLISNKIIVILFFPLLLFSWLQYQHIFFFSAAIALVIGFLLFSLNILGGGDAKLIAVLMLAIPYSGIISFLFFVSFTGLFVILFGWIFARESIKKNGLPYGVAINVGFIINYWFLH
ncbi:prepilin peptidase CpaA [Volucribacter psittacicida]|uniref:Prepilin peptidase CpaA n=1 Tax=Volucribacter psittacicida TaxID=203482 RepID=A0A4R1FU47_9PAST|nr:prepilin peptidase [Volucribacter psittacicida]TCJ97820.1 prepilin peptidase CpaA [Volucribacter psittacicida]